MDNKLKLRVDGKTFAHVTVKSVDKNFKGDSIKSLTTAIRDFINENLVDIGPPGFVRAYLKNDPRTEAELLREEIKELKRELKFTKIHQNETRRW